MAGSLVFLFLTWHVPSVTGLMMAGAVSLSLADASVPWDHDALLFDGDAPRAVDLSDGEVFEIHLAHIGDLLGGTAAVLHGHVRGPNQAPPGTACATSTSLFGAARRKRVDTIGASSKARVRGSMLILVRSRRRQRARRR